MPRAADPAFDAAPAAQPQRRIEPHARYEQPDERQTHPPFRAVLVHRTVAGFLREVALRVPRTVVANALRDPHARYASYDFFRAVRRHTARAARVVVLREEHLAVFALLVFLRQRRLFEAGRGVTSASDRFLVVHVRVEIVVYGCELYVGVIFACNANNNAISF